MSGAPKPAISPFRAGWAGRCPRCGQGRMFNGLLSIAPTCTSCGLKLSTHDLGDGAPYFVIMILSVLAILLGAWMDKNGASSITLLLILLPLILGLSIALLRITKGWLLAFQYYYRSQDFES